MIHLVVKSQSDIDKNLEAEWGAAIMKVDEWLSYLKSLTYVMDAEWFDSYTVLTFESEEYKTWFLMRWS